MFGLLNVLGLLASCVSFVIGACNVDETNLNGANWMSIGSIQNRRVADLMLLGSHDAGALSSAINPAVSARGLNGLTTLVTLPIGSIFTEHGRNRLHNIAITQSLDLEQQMCQGFRIFDVRFRGDGKRGDLYWDHRSGWNINHSSFYTFQNMGVIVDLVKDFCRQHPTELVILRTKVESTKFGDGRSSASEKVFLQEFADELEECLIAPAAGGADLLFSTKTIKSLLEFPRGRLRNLGSTTTTLIPTGGVLIMNYECGDRENLCGLSAAADFFAWPYNSVIEKKIGTWPFSTKSPRQVGPANMDGKFSNKNNVGDTVAGQQAKYTQWKVRQPRSNEPVASIADPEVPNSGGNIPPLMFGWWMTLTGGDVRENNKRMLFDNTVAKPTRGLYGGWVHDLINKQFVDPWGMKGITIWTDFCGEIPSLRDAMVQVNRNMDAGVDQFANIVAVVPGAAISPVPAAGKPLFTFNNPLSGYTSLAARGNPLPNPALPVIAPVPPVLVAPAIGAPVLSFKVVEGKRKLRKARHDKKQHQKVLVGHQEQSFLQVSNYVTPLRWCDDPEDEETTIDTRDRKTSDCFEDHAWVGDDLCDAEIASDDLQYYCNICHEDNVTPLVAFDEFLTQCPEEVAGLKGLGCCVKVTQA